MAATVLASSLGYVDGSVVNVGLVAIGRKFSADANALQWVIDAYLLPLSALLLLGGAAGDRFGRRRTLMAGIALFAVGSTACAVAPKLELLIAGRFVQGIGAALLAPNSLAILGHSFSGAAKGRAVGVWAAAGAVAGAGGPVLGGWLIDLGSWRAIFLVNLPFATAALLLAWRFLPRDRDTRSEPIDVAGGALASLGLGALTWGLTIGSGAEPRSAIAIGAGLTGSALLTLLWRVEKARGDEAMLPLVLFGSRPFIAITLLTLFLYGALGELVVLLPFVLIKGAGFSAVAAGASLLPIPIILALTSPLAGSVAVRTGAKLPLIVGPLVVAFGFALALRIGPGVPFGLGILPCVVVIAVGLTMVVAPLTTAVLSSVDAQHTGAASGLNTATAQTGALIATALLGTVLTSHGPALLAQFHRAMLVGAAACAAAAASALGLARK